MVFYGLNVCISLKSVSPNPSAQRHVYKARSLGGDWVTEVDPTGMGLCPYKRPQRTLSPLLFFKRCILSYFFS